MNSFKQIAFSSFIAVGIFNAANPCLAAEMNGLNHSFTEAPFIPPNIIADLNTWLSDDGDQVVAINLTDSVESNRYFGEIKTKSAGSRENPYVFTDDSCANEACKNFGPPSFGYSLVGKTANGLFVLFTEESGGGSGRFRSLMFVSLEKDQGLAYDEEKRALRLNRERWLIRKLGELPLGDRYAGNITVKGNVIHIGKDSNDHSAGVIDKDETIRLELAH